MFEIKWYILDENHTPRVADVIEAGIWMEKKDNIIVKKTQVDKNILVSTVFISLDHSFEINKKHIPILFETMIFGGEYDQYQERYETWDQALEGHEECIQMIFKVENND